MSGDKIYTNTSNEYCHMGHTGSNSLDDAVRRKLNIAPASIDIDDRNDPPALNETILRPLDSYTAFPRGRDYMVPRVRIVPNTHPKADDNDTAIHISQGSQGVSLSIETLEAILSWAKGKSE